MVTTLSTKRDQNPPPATMSSSSAVNSCMSLKSHMSLMITVLGFRPGTMPASKGLDLNNPAEMICDVGPIRAPAPRRRSALPPRCRSRSRSIPAPRRAGPPAVRPYHAPRLRCGTAILLMTALGPKVALTAQYRHFRSTPIYGHHQAGSVGPHRPTFSRPYVAPGGARSSQRSAVLSDQLSHRTSDPSGQLVPVTFTKACIQARRRQSIKQPLYVIVH